MKWRGVLLLPYPFNVGFRDYHEEVDFLDQLQRVTPEQLVSEEIGFVEDWQDRGYGGPYVFEVRAKQ
tara:strand:- start:2754 stop:2954 length:201 start_codon:yes stop_codon:yes gene_type:complete